MMEGGKWEMKALNGATQTETHNVSTFQSGVSNGSGPQALHSGPEMHQETYPASAVIHSSNRKPRICPLQPVTPEYCTKKATDLAPKRTS